MVQRARYKRAVHAYLRAQVSSWRRVGGQPSPQNADCEWGSPTAQSITPPLQRAGRRATCVTTPLPVTWRRPSTGLLARMLVNWCCRLRPAATVLVNSRPSRAISTVNEGAFKTDEDVSPIAVRSFAVSRAAVAVCAAAVTPPAVPVSRWRVHSVKLVLAGAPVGLDPAVRPSIYSTHTQSAPAIRQASHSLRRRPPIGRRVLPALTLPRAAPPPTAWQQSLDIDGGGMGPYKPTLILSRGTTPRPS